MGNSWSLLRRSYGHQQAPYSTARSWSDSNECVTRELSEPSGLYDNLTHEESEIFPSTPLLLQIYHHDYSHTWQEDQATVCLSPSEVDMLLALKTSMDSETGNTTHKYAGPALLRQLQAKIYHVDSSLAEPNLWGNALRLYQRVASELDRYPRALVLNDVETDLANPIFDGHYADVFKGHSADGDVAVKRFRLAGTSKQNLDFSKALLAEALVWRHLDHANILPFLGLMTSSEQDEHHAELSLLCMVTPWAQNGNLRRYLDATEGISLSEKHSLILGIAEGLAYLHDAGIIHGDLRGVNIMVDANSCPRLGDYGLSQLVEAWPVLASRKKAEGPTRWTAPELLSPEHFDRESSEPTYASDVYAFACVCYEVYTSQSPFHALKREASVIFRVLDSKRPEFTVEDCAGGLPPQAMQELIRRSWDQMPDNRPQIHEVLRRLKQ